MIRGYGMELQLLRRRCERRLRDLPLPIPFDVHVLAEAIAARRDRPIVLQPQSLGDGVSGAWVAGPEVDIVFYEEHAAPLHQQHIILHELAHIVCGHKGIPLAALESLLGDPSSRLRGGKRENYRSPDEWEAEILASLILERVQRSQLATMSPHTDAATLLRFLDSIEGTSIDG